jgi:hypothetical protein
VSKVDSLREWQTQKTGKNGSFLQREKQGRSSLGAPLAVAFYGVVLAQRVAFQSSGIMMRVRLGWPPKRTPKRSKTSRS